jgi:hypothetical protein
MVAPDNPSRDRQGTLCGMLARFWWMFFGNVVGAIALVFVAENRRGFFHPADAVFWAAVASLVLVRYLDVAFLDGCTGTGERTSLRHWVRYAVVLTALALVLWALAHVANYLLS